MSNVKRGLSLTLGQCILDWRIGVEWCIQGLWLESWGSEHPGRDIRRSRDNEWLEAEGWLEIRCERWNVQTRSGPIEAPLSLLSKPFSPLSPHSQGSGCGPWLPNWVLFQITHSLDLSSPSLLPGDTILGPSFQFSASAALHHPHICLLLPEL